MKKILNISFILALALVIFGLSSCEESDDYDYDAIVPRVLDHTGPAAVAAHGLADFPYTYSANYHRGGSSLEWTITTELTEGEVIVTTEDVGTFSNKIARVVFPQRSVEDVATFTIRETTLGGVTSEPYTFTVVLNPFCPEDMEPWAGTWSSTTVEDHDELVATIPANTLNTLEIYGFLGYLVEVGWAENWIPETGGVGTTVVEFDCDNQIIVAEQLLGETYEWGEYWIRGDGSFDPETMTMTVRYEIAWSEGGGTWEEFTSELSMEKLLKDRTNFKTSVK